jgi:SynChlorMet cassette radical SAM/SPASM protein ScmF
MTFRGLSEWESDEQPITQTINLPDGVPRLRAFYLYLSSSCNLRCRHCWTAPEYSAGAPLQGKTIDIEALHDAVIEGKTLGLSNAKLTGGEPMLHPRFKEIVNMLTAEGIEMNMETNGTLMNSEIAEYLKNYSKVGFISVSLDSPNPAEHDTFRGVKGAFMATLNGLDAMVAAGFKNCQVIMAVHRGNMHQMLDLTLLAKEHGAGSVKFNPVTKTGRGILMHEKGETLEFEEYINLARYVNNELRPSIPIPIYMSMPLALTPFHELWRTKGKACDCGVIGILGILGGGEIALCGIGQTINALVYGHLGKDRIRDIWLNHPIIQGLRRDLEDTPSYPGVCGVCIHAKSCRTGCIADNYRFGGTLLSPSWLCEQAYKKGVFPETRLKR